jgi:hypothetical protein
METMTINTANEAVKIVLVGLGVPVVVIILWAIVGLIRGVK